MCSLAQSHSLHGTLKKMCPVYIDFCDLRGSHSSPTAAQASAFTLLFDLKTPQLQTKSMAQLASCWCKHHCFWGVHHAQSVYNIYNVDAVNVNVQITCVPAMNIGKVYLEKRPENNIITTYQNEHRQIWYICFTYIILLGSVSVLDEQTGQKKSKALKHVTKRRLHLLLQKSRNISQKHQLCHKITWLSQTWFMATTAAAPGSALERVARCSRWQPSPAETWKDYQREHVVTLGGVPYLFGMGCSPSLASGRLSLPTGQFIQILVV